MSNFETNKAGNLIKTVYVLPSECQWSDIEQLQAHNRGANEPKEKLDELMRSVKARGGFVNAAKGYVEGDSFMLTSGSRRLAVGQALESEGETVMLPVTLIKKPKTKEEIIDAMLDNDVDNNVRNADSDIVRHSTYSILRNDLGLTLKEIGEKTGVSHTLVANTLKVFTLEPLRKEIEAGKLSVRAATEFVGEKYQKLDSNNKPVSEIITNDEGKKVRRPVYDLEKIKKDLSGAKAEAASKGKGKLGTTTVQQSSREAKEDATGMKMVKIILDEPEDNVPTGMRLFCRLLNDNLTLSTFKAAIKKNKLEDDFEWLFDVEFNIKKRAIAKEKAAEASKKAKGASKKTTSTPSPKGKKTEEAEEILDADEYE